MTISNDGNTTLNLNKNWIEDKEIKKLHTYPTDIEIKLLIKLNILIFLH